MNLKSLFPTTALVFAMTLAVHADDTTSTTDGSAVTKDESYWTNAVHSQPSGKGETAQGVEYLFRVKIPTSDNKRIIGISGVRYNPKTESITLVSNDTGFQETQYDQGEARFYEISKEDILDLNRPAVARNFDNKDAPETVLQQGERTSQWINHGHADIQDVEVMKDGRLMLVSQHGSANMFFWVWKWSKNWIPFPYYLKPHKPDYSEIPKLLIVDQGVNTGSYYFPDHYQNDGWVYSQGVQRNRSIKSITRVPGKDTETDETDQYMVITAGALAQDEDAWALTSRGGIAPCRMLLFDRSHITNRKGETVDSTARVGHINPSVELLYQISPLPEDLLYDAKPGYPIQEVTSAKSPDAKTVIVLERSIVEYKSESKEPLSVARVYSADITTGDEVTWIDTWPYQSNGESAKEMADVALVQKKTLLDSIDFENIYPGLSKQSIEGIDLIPYKDHQQILMLVNDSHASSESPEGTFLTFFLVPKAL